MTSIAAPARPLLVGSNVGIFEATPDGDSYRLRPLGPSGHEIVSIVVDVHDPRRLYAGTRDDGVYRSEDGGETWQESGKGLLYREVWSMAQARTGELYAGTQPPAVFKSTDGGQNWQNCRRFQDMEESLHWTFPRAPHIAHVKDLQVSESDPRYVYGAIEEGWVVRSTDGGETWETLKQGVAFDSHAITLIPAAPQVVIATSGAGVYRSENQGDRFVKSDQGIRSGFTGGGYMSSAAVHPDRPNVVYVGGAEVPPPFWFTRSQGALTYFYRSDDQGRTWRRLQGRGLPEEIAAAPRSCAIDPTDPDRVFWGMTDGSVWMTPDGGESFSQVVTGLPGWIVGLRVLDAGLSRGQPAPSASPARASNSTAHPPAAETGTEQQQQDPKVGEVYEITIADEINAPVIGANGVARINGVGLRIPNAKRGETYRVRVLAVGINGFTGRPEATVQTV